MQISLYSCTPIVSGAFKNRRRKVFACRPRENVNIAGHQFGAQSGIENVTFSWNETKTSKIERGALKAVRLTRGGGGD